MGNGFKKTKIKGKYRKSIGKNALCFKSYLLEKIQKILAMCLGYNFTNNPGRFSKCRYIRNILVN